LSPVLGRRRQDPQTTRVPRLRRPDRRRASSTLSNAPTTQSNTVASRLDGRIRDRLGDGVIGILEEHAPDVRQRIVAREVLTPRRSRSPLRPDRRPPPPRRAGPRSAPADAPDALGSGSHPRRRRPADGWAAGGGSGSGVLTHHPTFAPASRRWWGYSADHGGDPAGNRLRGDQTDSRGVGARGNSVRSHRRHGGWRHRGLCAPPTILILLSCHLNPRTWTVEEGVSRASSMATQRRRDLGGGSGGRLSCRRVHPSRMAGTRLTSSQRLGEAFRYPDIESEILTTAEGNPDLCRYPRACCIG